MLATVLIFLVCKFSLKITRLCEKDGGIMNMSAIKMFNRTKT